MKITGPEHLQFIIFPQARRPERRRKKVAVAAVLQKAATLDGAKVIHIICSRRRRRRKFTLQVWTNLYQFCSLIEYAKTARNTI